MTLPTPRASFDLTSATAITDAPSGDRKSGRKGPRGSTRREVLIAIGVLTSRHGYPPTVREVAAFVRVSLFCAQRHVAGLEKVGSVEQKRTPDGRVLPRTIAVVKREAP